MSKLNIFYHIYLYDKIDTIVSDQLNKLINSELILNSNLYVVIIDNYNGKYKMNDINLNLIKKYAKEIYEYNINYYELKTLDLMYDKVCSDISDEYYLYIHTKGVTRINDNKDNNVGYSYKNVENWRNIMEHFNIEQWRTCIENLKLYDLVGCNYFPINYIPGIPAHYSGNFWWSKTSYIKKLPKLNINNNLTESNRFNAEFWIGQIKHKALCLFPIPNNPYKNRNYYYTDKKEYVNNIIKTEYKNYE
jgi:hypothetical protein